MSLAELQRAGLVLSADEVVALAQNLIHSTTDEIADPPFGPLAPARIRIGSNGSVACMGCAATPGVAELAILLHELLRRTPHVPGGLRYAIGRALHEVDAPPFDSLEEFAATIVRYAPRHADDTLRRMVARWDRRMPARSTAELRLQLREADRRLYESQMRRDPPPTHARASGWAVGVIVAGALTTIAAASLVGDRPPAMPAVAAPPVSVMASPVVPDGTVHVRPVLGTAVARRPRPHPKRPQTESHQHTIRLRWFHTRIQIRDDLTRP